MKKYLFSLIAITIIGMTAGQSTVYAADSGCKPLYGGGATKEQACNGKSSAANKVTPAPTKAKTQAKPTPTPAKTGNTTKGGLPVVSPTPVKKTPSTGPEMLGIIALVPAAATGFYLRKKN